MQAHIDTGSCAAMAETTTKSQIQPAWVRGRAHRRLAARRTIAIVAFDHCQALDVVGPWEVFAKADEFAELANVGQLSYEMNWALPRLAQRCGFGSVDALHRAMRRRLGFTPGQYRERFSLQSFAQATTRLE
ncbi:MAG: AraC family transcriptional regulator [Steroidobacteraceae bacterium]